MEEMEGAGIESSSDKRLVRRHLTVRYSKLKTQPKEEETKKAERILTQFSPANQKPDVLSIRRRSRRKSFADATDPFPSGCTEHASTKPKKSLLTKEHNRKSIQLYTSQAFFKMCLNDRTKEEQQTMRSQWKYLGKYGGEFQIMGLRALANLPSRREPRKLSMLKRSSLDFEEDGKVRTRGSIRA